MVFSAFELKTSTLISCSAFRTVWAHTGKEHWIAKQFLPDASNVDAQCRVTIKIFFICVWVLATPWKTSSVNGFSIQMEFCLMLYCSSWHKHVSCTITILVFSIAPPKSVLFTKATWLYVIAMGEICFSDSTNDTLLEWLIDLSEPFIATLKHPNWW